MKNQYFKTSLKLFTGLLISLGITSVAPKSWAAEKVPTIEVAKTKSEVPNCQPAIGEGLAQMMITELTKLSNFEVLESVALDDLREERKLGENGEVSEDERVKKGQWRGAEREGGTQRGRTAEDLCPGAAYCEG